MKIRSTHIISLFILLLCGCSNSTPTQVHESNDEMIAAVITGTAGYESNGLAAMIEDAVVIESGREIRGRGRLTEVELRGASYDSSTGRASVDLQRRSTGGADLSEWRLDYRLVAGRIDSVATAGTEVMVESRTRGIYRTGGLRIEGESAGRMQMLSSGGDRTPSILGGEYRWSGGSSNNGRREYRFDDIVVRFSWQELQATIDSVEGKVSLSGRCDVTVSVNGPEGAVVRNGSLSFKGDGRAELVIGGRHHMLSV